MKKKTFYILLAVWILALATLIGTIGFSLNKDEDGSNVSTPPTTQQGSGSNNNGGNSGNNGGNSGNNGGGSNSDAGNDDEDDGKGNVYGDDGRDWIGG